MLRTPLAVVILWLNSLAPAIAQVGDPTLRTDHPQYPGEGAFQTIEDCVAFATAGQTEPQEKAIALYNWLLTHQWHLKSPREWCIPGRTPDTEQTGDYENVVYDANIGRFSYGYGLCGTVHAWNEPYWHALGMRARRRAFPGHTNSEVFYDGSWHAFDTDMAGLLFRPDGVVAGYADIIADPSLADSVKPPHPHYPFAWPGDFNTMKRGWQQVGDGGHWYAMYNGGYAVQPGIIHLRKGETFTRYYDPDHYGGPSKRRFWHHQKDGPSRPWSFYGQDEPHHDGATHNARNDVTYCNGEFVYRPDLTNDTWEQGIVQRDPYHLITQNHSPRITSEFGPVSVAFAHWSPYVIAGDPNDDVNPMTGRATGGLTVKYRSVGEVQVKVSADQGQTWDEIDSPPHTEGDTTTLDLTEYVKGHFGWWLRFRFDVGSGLDELEFRTVTQVCPSIYPQLTPNGCVVTHRAASRAVIPVIPNFGQPESEVSQFEAIELRTQNVTCHGRSENNRFVYRTTDNRPGQIVFKVLAPQMLSEVHAAIRYQLRVPPPENADYHLDISTNGGETWKTFATADIPADNEHSSGWLAGSVDISGVRTAQALVRVHMYAGGHKTGLIDARLYGIYETAEPGPLAITYGWKENGQSRQHTETIAAGTREATFTIPTGTNIKDEFIRMTAQ